MVLRLGRRAFGAGRLLVMAVVDPAAGLQGVHAAVSEGADMVEIGGAVPVIAAVRSAYPELVIGVRTARDEVAREACAAGADLVSGPGVGVAAEFGAGVVCSLAGAQRAVEAGVEPERIIVGVAGGREVADVVAAGWPALVSVSGPDPAGSLATAAVGAWLGARVFRVEQVGESRRALRMVSAIRGDIPPAYAVRGLALGRFEGGPERAVVGGGEAGLDLGYGWHQ